MLGVPIPLPLRRLKGTDLWYASVELPRGARIQYRILVRRGEHMESMNDPLNPRVVGDAIGSQSVLEADGLRHARTGRTRIRLRWRASSSICDFPAGHCGARRT